MKAAVIGANGQLGSDLCQALAGAGHEVLPLTHAEIEVSDADAVQAVLGRAGPDVVVNTAAMHHVEQCEQDPTGAFAINATGARNLAVATEALGSKLLHVSTDYVFDGAKRAPYAEADPALPLNVYGNSKLAGEFFVRTLNPRHYVVRVSGIYGHSPCRAKGGLNFVELMLKLAAERPEVRVVDDEALTPTFTRDIAQQVAALVTTDAYGLYHASAQGECSWYAFAQEIWRLAGLTTPLNVADPGEFPAKVPRPKYSVLDNAALRQHGLDRMRDWQAGLADYLATRG